MLNIKRLKEFLDNERVKYKDDFYKNYKAIRLIYGADDTQLRHIIDFCNNNGLFYAIDKFSKFYIF